MRIQTREATLNDFDTIYELIGKLSSFSHVEKTGRESVEETYEDLLADYDHLILVATSENKVLGFVSVFLRKSLSHRNMTATIDEIVVSENFRGQGIGAELINSTVERATRLNCCEMEVVTEKDNAEARRFYRRCGFHKVMVFLERELE